MVSKSHPYNQPKIEFTRNFEGVTDDLLVSPGDQAESLRVPSETQGVQ
jgi:hypothetical protein